MHRTPVGAAGSSTLVDLGCAAPIYVQFSPAPQGEVFVENTGSEFNVTIKSSTSSKIASGYFQSLSLTESKAIITRNDIDGAATSIKLVLTGSTFDLIPIVLNVKIS